MQKEKCKNDENMKLFKKPEECKRQPLKDITNAFLQEEFNDAFSQVKIERLNKFINFENKSNIKNKKSRTNSLIR
jgi:hypothetical protein